MPDPVQAEILDCGSCSACCHQLVILRNHEGPGLLWEADPETGYRYLRRRADGSCVHLVDGTCSVYENRPTCCRIFHCGKWFARMAKEFGPRFWREQARHTDPEGVDKQYFEMVRQGRTRANSCR